MTELVAGGPPEPDVVPEIARRYGLVMERPEWLPDLIERYHLTPPPG
jgi:hypothetical protein